METKIGDVWYRYEDIVYAAPLDEFDNPCGKGRPDIRLLEFYVTKITKCGVWLDCYKFVLNNSRKKFACKTKNDAKISFLARKERQLSILENKIKNIEISKKIFFNLKD